MGKMHENAVFREMGDRIKKIFFCMSVELKMTLVIVVLLSVRFFRMVPMEIAGYPAEQYLITYKYGFIARGLMGTLISPVKYLSSDRLYIVGLIVEFLISLFFIFLVYFGLRKVPDNWKTLCCIIIAVFVMSPMSPAYTYLINNFGRFDAVLVGIVMLQCLSMLRLKIIGGGVVIGLSFIGILIHPVYTFTYFVVGELLLIYGWMSERREKKAYWIAFFIINTLLVTGFFLYFEFIRGIDPQWTQDAMYADMQVRTNFDLGSNFYGYLNDWYFGTVESQMQNTPKPFNIQPGLLLATLVLMLPFEIILFGTWFKGLKNRSNEPGRRFFFFAMIMSFVASVPAFLTQIDYGRWCAGYFLSQGIIFIFCIFAGDKDVINSITGLKSWCQGHPFFAIVLTIYCCSLGVFKDIAMLEATDNGYAFFLNLTAVIKRIFGVE